MRQQWFSWLGEVISLYRCCASTLGNRLIYPNYVHSVMNAYIQGWDPTDTTDSPDELVHDRHVVRNWQLGSLILKAGEVLRERKARRCSLIPMLFKTLGHVAY